MKRVLLVVFAALAFAPAATSDATPETAKAVQDVREEVVYMQKALGAHPMSAGYLSSVAALDYTVGHVTAPLYGYLHEIQGSGLPNDTSEQILSTQAGICGHATIVFRQILAQLGFQTRQVDFVSPVGGHTTAEVLYDGAWHWFDPTFGDYYKHGGVLSIDAVRALKHPSAYAVTDQTLIWRQVVSATHTSMQTGMGMPTSKTLIVVH